MTDETSFTYRPEPVQPVADIMKPVIDRAIRARIAALTDNDKLVFAMKVHDSWCDERADTPSDVADAMVSLLAPETTEEPTG